MRTEESDGEEQNLPDGARPAPSRSRDRGATAVEYALIVALIASGMGVCESCREAGVSEKTYYRWRKAQADESGG